MNTEGREQRVPRSEGWANSAIKMPDRGKASQEPRAERILEGKIQIRVGARGREM